MSNACINPTRTRLWGYFSTALGLIIIYQPGSAQRVGNPCATTRVEYSKSHLHRHRLPRPNESWVGGGRATCLAYVYAAHCTQTKEGMVVSAISRH